MDKDNDFIGLKLREARDNLGWTREDLSQESGIPVRTIADIETGVSKDPQISNFIKAASAMKMSVSDIIGDSGDKARLLIEIYDRLPSLKEDELRHVLRLINGFSTFSKESS